MEYNLPTNATVTITLNASGAFFQLDWGSFPASCEQRGEEGQGVWVRKGLPRAWPVCRRGRILTPLSLCGTQARHGGSGTETHSPSLLKSPRIRGGWTVTPPNTCLRDQIPWGLQELQTTPAQPPPGLPWARCAVVTPREMDPDVSKQDGHHRQKSLSKVVGCIKGTQRSLG